MSIVGSIELRLSLRSSVNRTFDVPLYNSMKMQSCACFAMAACSDLKAFVFVFALVLAVMPLLVVKRPCHDVVLPLGAF